MHFQHRCNENKEEENARRITPLILVFHIKWVFAVIITISSEESIFHLLTFSKVF